MIYQIPAIGNAKSYDWSYGGSGVALTGNTNVITIDFTADATSGNLMVEGVNACGNGPSSPVFPVIVDQLPSDPGPIS